MSMTEELVEHYGGGDLIAAIEAGLAALSLTRATASVEVLESVDEFHVGGRTATTDLCERLGVEPGMALVDIGSGIGGTARFLASKFRCTVAGIDLAPNYVAAARELTAWTGLSESVRFESGSALEMPFDDGSFDGAVQLHVGMNIEDKHALSAEISRVLRPGGRFGLYDIMRTSDASLDFPVPWATDGSMSFVDDLPTYQAALEAAGFEVEAVRDRSSFANDFFAAMRERSAAAIGPAPLGLHLILGPAAAVKIGNMASAIAAGAIAPIEVICRKPA